MILRNFDTLILFNILIKFFSSFSRRVVRVSSISTDKSSIHDIIFVVSCFSQEIYAAFSLLFFVSQLKCKCSWHLHSFDRGHFVVLKTRIVVMGAITLYCYKASESESWQVSHIYPCFWTS